MASPAFLIALRTRLTWLAEHRDEEQIESFLTALESVRRRIARFPEAGPIVKRDTAHVLRLRLFPRPLPYLVYHGHAARRPIREVVMVGLYASGQQREATDMAEWPW